MGGNLSLVLHSVIEIQTCFRLLPKYSRSEKFGVCLVSIIGEHQ